jgi:peptidoglycan/LPS O-acetylase OafA/YrhL
MLPPMAPRVRLFGLHLLADHFPSLHGLRALAVVSVLQIHVTISLGAVGLIHDEAFYRRSASVWFGMDLFFILSGFLMGSLLLPADDARQGEGSRPVGDVTPGSRRAGARIGRFYLRRAFRIIPLYYVVLTTLALAFPLSAEQRAGLPFEYAYLINYHTFSAPTLMPWAWSLAVEEHFYLAIPLVAALLAFVPRTTWRIGALAALWLAGLGVRYAVFASRPTWTPPEMVADLYTRTHTRFDVLIAGVLLAHVQRAHGAQLRVILRRRPLLLAFAVVPAICCWALLGPLAGRYDLSTIFAWGTVTSVMYFCLLLILLNTESRITRWLSSRWFLRFATLGYGVYLVHPPVIGLVVVPFAAFMVLALHLPLAVVWVCSLVLLLVVATAVAYVLHLVVEKPALWLRDHVAG